MQTNPEQGHAATGRDTTNLTARACLVAVIVLRKTNPVSEFPGLIDEQYPMDMAIGGHVLRHVYEHETSAELSITVQNKQIQFNLTSDDQLINIPDDELVQAICELVGLHEQHGSGLSQAVYQYQKNPDGSWGFSSSYQYAGRP
ncbi:hypothetical protein [Nocardia fluminea]|uniref:hypothetical protein n=1 Tax=Nocardia fluminea TaxID=134984 RepID=UPI003659A6D0